MTNKFGDLGKNNRKYQEGKGGIGYLTIKFAGRVMIGQRRKKDAIKRLKRGGRGIKERTIQGSGESSLGGRGL